MSASRSVVDQKTPEAIQECALKRMEAPREALEGPSCAEIKPLSQSPKLSQTSK